MSNDQYGQHNPTDPLGQSAYGHGQSDPWQDQNSWGAPSQPQSASYDENAFAQQPAGGYSAPQSQASAGWQPEQPGAYAAQPQQPMQPTSTASRDDGVFKALFDFSFTKYATPSVVKVFYILGIVIGALYWIGGALFMMVAGGAASSYGSNDASGAIIGIVWLIFGAPVFFFYLVGLRMQLEFMIALIRTNQDTQAIRAKLGA